MFTAIRASFSRIYSGLTNSITAASSQCQSLNTHQYVDLCQLSNVEINQWNQQIDSEIAWVQSEQH